MLRYKNIGGFQVPVVPRADMPGDYRRLLRRLCEAQNWRCCYCGIEMTVGVHNKTDCATLEHVIPKSAGGSAEWDNLVAACRLCNNARGAMYARRFLQMVIWKGRERAAAWANRKRGQRKKAAEVH